MAEPYFNVIPAEYKTYEGAIAWAHRHKGKGVDMADEVGVTKQAVSRHFRERGINLKKIRAEYTALEAEEKALTHAINKLSNGLTTLIETGGGCRKTIFSEEYYGCCGADYYKMTAQERTKEHIELSVQDCINYVKYKYAQYQNNGIKEGFCPLMTPCDLVVTQTGAGFDAETLKAFLDTKEGRAGGEEGAKDLSRLDHTKSKSLFNCAYQHQTENRAEAQHRRNTRKGRSLDKALEAEHKAKQDIVFRDQLIAQAIESIGREEWSKLANHPATGGITLYWLAAIVVYRPYAEKYPIDEYDFVFADGRIVLQHNVTAIRVCSITSELEESIDTNRKIKHRLLRDNPDFAKMELGASLAVWMLYAISKDYNPGSRFWYALRDTIIFLFFYRDELPPELHSICGQFLALKEGELDKPCPNTALTGLIVDGAWEAMKLPICIVSPTISDSLPHAAAADLFDPEDDWEIEEEVEQISDTERREKIISLQNELMERWNSQNIALTAKQWRIQTALFAASDLVGRFTRPGGSR